MTVHRGYQVNQDEVVDEVIDGEAVMIHLKTGTYYCTNAVGAHIWESLLAAPGSTVADLAARVARTFAVDGADVAADVGVLVDTLCEQDLVSPVEARSAVSDDASPEEPAPNGDSPYEAPAIETFTDLQDLLLLDPVHDVGTTGWPRTDS